MESTTRAEKLQKMIADLTRAYEELDINGDGQIGREELRTVA